VPAAAPGSRRGPVGSLVPFLIPSEGAGPREYPSDARMSVMTTRPSYCTILSTKLPAQGARPGREACGDTRRAPTLKILFIDVDNDDDLLQLSGSRVASARPFLDPARANLARTRHELRAGRVGHRSQAAPPEGPAQGERAGGLPGPRHLPHGADGRAVPGAGGVGRGNPAHPPLPAADPRRMPR